MTTPTISLTETAILTALRAFLIAVIPSGIEVVRGLINRVPEPDSPTFIVMTTTLRERIETNTDTYDTVGLATTFLTPVKVTVQIDVHGPTSGDLAQVITTIFRDDFAYQIFAPDTSAVAPLYCVDPRQASFLNAEQQVEERWIIDAVLQANPTIIAPQDSALVVTVGLIDVGITYPG